MTRLTRSSYVKIALIVALALLLFAVAGAGSMRGCSQGIYLGGGTEMGNASVDAKSERNLSVSWAAGSVDISVVDDGAGDVIELVETAPTGLTKAQQMRWSVSGGTLKVDYGSWWSCFALGQKRLEVRIPERYAQSLGAVTVDGASGYYRVAGIGCDTLRLKLASGEIDADGLAAAALDVDVASGQVRAEGTVFRAEIGDFVEIFPAKIRQWRVGIYVQQCGKAVLRDAGGIDKAAAPVRLTAVRVGHIAVAVRRVAVSQLGLPEGGH